MVETTQLNDVTNEFIARGRIVGFGRNYQGHQELYVYIRGAHQERPINAAFSYSQIDPQLVVGDYVEVKGFVNAYFRRSEAWDGELARGYSQTFIATSITPIKPELAEVFGVSGGFSYGHMFFRLYYQGEVTRVDESQGRITTPNRQNVHTTFTRVLVRTPQTNTARRSNIISAQYTSRMRVHDIAPQPGDKVVVVANLSTNRKRFEDQRETVYFRNLIIDDMFVVERSNRQEELPSESNIDNSQSMQIKSQVAQSESASSTTVSESVTPASEVVTSESVASVETSQSVASSVSESTQSVISSESESESDANGYFEMAEESEETPEVRELFR